MPTIRGAGSPFTHAQEMPCLFNSCRLQSRKDKLLVSNILSQDHPSILARGVWAASTQLLLFALVGGTGKSICAEPVFPVSSYS